MKRFRGLICVALALACGCAGSQCGSAADVPTASGCVSSAIDRVALGFTLTHYEVHLDRLGLCDTDRGATTEEKANIVLHYDDPAVRQRVRPMLQQMAQEGAQALRTILWYRLAEDVPMAHAVERHDHLGYPVATGGILPNGYIENLKEFARDVAEAGYKRLYINMAPQGTSNPITSARTCRPGMPNCWHPDYLQEVWSVADQVIGELRKDSGSRIDLVFDIASESCFLPDPNSELEQNLARQVRYMVSHYASTYGSGGFVVSCIGVRAQRALPDLKALQALYQELNVRPAAVDVHMYPLDAGQAEAILLAASQAATALSVPLDISETFANDPMVAQLLEQLAGSGKLSNLRTVLVFPHSRSAVCHADVSPPYDVGGLERMFGLLDERGRRKPACSP
ncbi:MAG TPA: hypothetical protein VKS60_17085 [Stellaceae bacterium]|nr:hypothetical protein [Stellaceae bacterium]